MTNFDLKKVIQDKKKKIEVREGKPFEVIIKDIVVAASTDPTFTKEQQEQAKKLIPYVTREAIRACSKFADPL